MIYGFSSVGLILTALSRCENKNRKAFPIFREQADIYAKRHDNLRLHLGLSVMCIFSPSEGTKKV